MLLEKVFEPIVAGGPLADSVMNGYRRLVSIYKFIELPQELIEKEQLTAALNRVHYATALEGISYDIEAVKLIVSNQKQALERFEREIYGYHQAEIFLYNHLQQAFDVYLVNDVQRIFFAYPSRQHVLDLFTTNIYEDRGVDLARLYDCGLASMLSWLENDKTLDPLTQSWVLHFFVIMKGPFGQTNPKIGRLLQFYWLLRHNLTLAGMLQLEKELFHQRKAYQDLIKQAENERKNMKEEGLIDFSKYIQFGLQVHADHLEGVKITLREYYKKTSGPEKLKPRLKNVVNYIFEYGCQLDFENHFGLNERQSELMRIIYRQGVVQTKELFDKFDVNRKTLQRDFNELAELGLIRVLGEGRGLKYTVKLNHPLPRNLEVFQAAFAKDLSEENEPAEAMLL